MFDLLPFQRLKYGENLKPGIENVYLVFDPNHLILETTVRDANGERVVYREEASLGIKEGFDAPHEIVRTYLEMDEVDWIMVGDIFDPKTTQRFAEKWEAQRSAEE